MSELHEQSSEASVPVEHPPADSDSSHKSNGDTRKSQDDLKEVDESDNSAGDDMEDLFGEDEDEEDEGQKKGEENEAEEEPEDISRPRQEMDDEEAEEHAMYTRKFYGEDMGRESDEEEAHQFKEEDVELVRHIVPYKATQEEQKSELYYAKIPEFLTIDPVPFDPPSFEARVKERLASKASKEDLLGDRLIDENTVRWRYSRDSNQQVYKESNAQIVQWSDGTFSLKLGDEYTDILANETDNTFFAVSHDQQELMQCYEGGEISKTLMFIPTSTSSRMHQKLTKAVMRRDQKQAAGPGTYIVQKDPELERGELERKQQQVVRERRRRQMRDQEARENADPDKRSRAYSMEVEPEGNFRRNEYEQDDFLVNDEEEEEYDTGSENEEEASDEDARAERLRNLKREGASNYDGEPKRRKIAVIDDEDDE
ncbi:LEO1 (YOR123C) [Zygosaccharomyces parabailii]|nr:LEO1 (YOR123C) [Zygosaccharomyces parabailii]